MQYFVSFCKNSVLSFLSNRNRIVPSLVLALVILTSNLTFSQVNYLMSITNQQFTNGKTFEFDIFIKSVGRKFTLTSYQCVFTFNYAIANGGNLSFVLIEGTSQLTNIPLYSIGIKSLERQYKLTFGSMVGSDLIPETGLRVGRFRLQNSVLFQDIDPNIAWCFKGQGTTILTVNVINDITNPGNHVSSPLKKSSGLYSHVPKEYKLLQNYPNPFNPATKINFELPMDGHVTISVYNSIGEKVNVLVNDYLSAGYHSVDFIGKGLTNGVYFCKMEVEGSIIEIIKMLMLK